jgi:NADPH-dependent 2,4-dienoyl-CoA reductase/sulfur reductase-like enzyme
MKFVIIGGDAAGMSAASRAKRNRPDFEVTVLEQTNDVSYSACGMPYNIADESRAIDDLVVRQAQIFREKQGIDLRTGHQVEAIERSRKLVRGRMSAGTGFELAYDKLLIATGATPIKPGLPGFDLPGVMALKSLEDGRRIKKFIYEQQVKKVVIVGIGYIGLEMCEAFRARNISVQMVKPGPVFLPWLNSQLSERVKAELEVNKVEIHLGRQIKGIEKSNQGLCVVCSDGELDCQMVLIGIGLRPNSQLAENAGLELGPEKAISVNKALQTSDRDIFAAGDCADAYHIVTSQKAWIPLALRANRAGWAAADNITGEKVELPGIAGTAVFKLFDLQVARTGLNSTEAQKAGFDAAEEVIQSRTRAHAHPGASMMDLAMVADRRSGRLLGVQMVGPEGVAHRINAIAVALHAGMRVAEFSQTDLAYAPPFSPVWDPMLTLANQMLKKIA